MDITLENNQINVSVFAYKPERQDQSIIQFSISVTTRNNHTWILEKRFSHFEKLNQELKDYFGDTLPPLPKKSYLTFLMGKSHDDIEQRRFGLDFYLKNLIVRNEVFNSLPLREFLEVDNHFTEAIVNPPQLLIEFKGFLHAVRDFHINQEQGVMFVINSDANMMTRLDAYITNMKMPWESEQGGETLIPVSCVECWIQQDSGEYERSWTKLYNSQAISMHWEYKTCTLLIGLDSGSINLLTVPQKDNNFKRYEESMEIEQHSERVMGIYFDPEKSLIHSVSKDKKYRVLDLDKQSLVADYEPSNFELTYLLVSSERKRSFIGDRCGSIYIFDISNSKPQALVHLATTIKMVRGIYLDNIKNYLFVLGFEEGNFIVYDIQKPGNEQHSKEVARMKNKPKSREICWSAKRGEIYIGNQDGTITIWDAKKAAPLYVMKAHELDITKMVWSEETQTLISSSKDKMIKVWLMPASWRDKAVVEKEESEKNIADKTKTMVQMQQKSQKKQIDSGDEDELSSWHQ